MDNQSFDWLLHGCHALSEVAVAYFPNYQYNCSAVKAHGSGIHPAYHNAHSSANCDYCKVLGNACISIRNDKKEFISCCPENGEKDIMYFNTFFFSFIY